MKEEKSIDLSSEQNMNKLKTETAQQDYGLVGLVGVFIILLGYNFYKGLPVNDLLAIFWGYFGMSYFSKYRVEKKGLQLAVAIFGLVAAISFLANYIITTW